MCARNDEVPHAVNDAQPPKHTGAQCLFMALTGCCVSAVKDVAVERERSFARGGEKGGDGGDDDDEGHVRHVIIALEA